MHSSARQVIIVVFDGLRRDMVTPALTPNLLRLADRGQWFREARSVFPSVTRVATSSISTGAFPSAHGIVGNLFHLPAVSPLKTFDSRHRSEILRAEAVLPRGSLLTAPTLGDCLAEAGKTFALVHTGTAGAAHFLNPRAAQHSGHWTFSIHGREATGTPNAVDEVEAVLGEPKRVSGWEVRVDDVTYATDALLKHVLPTLKPDVALMWYSEPDVAFHFKGIGSDEALAAVRHCDKEFGRLLDWVDSQPNSDDIAIVAASDHGQITMTEQVDLNHLLTSEGFPAKEGHLEGAALATTGGNSGEIRLLDGCDKRTLPRLAAWLLEQPFLGMLFARGSNGIEGSLPGTFAFDLVGLNHARAPDLFYVLKSSDAVDRYGLPGTGTFTDMVPIGGGLHGGLNRGELNTVLIIALPGAMEAGVLVDAPAGIIDIAPTALGLLGLSPPPAMVGVGLHRIDPHDYGQSLAYQTGSGQFSQEIALFDMGNGRRFISNGGRSGDEVAS